jgi:hypothetical protein
MIYNRPSSYPNQLFNKFAMFGMAACLLMAWLGAYVLFQ